MGIQDPPKSVRWERRTDGVPFRGTVVAEGRVEVEKEHGDYMLVVQEIRGGYDDEEEEKWIRFGYYVKNHGSPDENYHWASQTTLAEKAPWIKQLLGQALTENII